MGIHIPLISMVEECEMPQPLKVGIIGNFNPNSPSHAATDEALSHAARALSVTLTTSWLPTQQLDDEFSESTLNRFDALWCAPGSPYKSMSGALKAIRFAREKDWPFMGTCGGFQHTLVEFARNVLEIYDAKHEETAPHASRLVISRLTCSLAGQTQSIKITPGTCAHQAYGKEDVVEEFRCSYGLNPAYRSAIGNGGLKIAGVDLDSEVRIVELPDHRFFMATLFVPQLSSRPDMPHPLIIAYLKAVLAFQGAKAPDRCSLPG